MATTTFSFPELRNLELRAFSLYRRVPDAEVHISGGVSCFVGANGLGKSTLIAAVNYALTGRVAEPGRPFSSADEYYRETQAHTRDYFAGRIDEDDRPAAEVRLDFSVGGASFSVRRGFFDLSELRGLRIVEEQRLVYEGDSDSTAGSELQARYEAELCARSGFQTFSQFVFLQLLVLTFDERRHLAFWDSKTLQQMLFLAFGVDAATAARAEVLARTVERQDSLARNYQWQATDGRKKLKDLDKATAQIEDADDAIGERHRALFEQEQETLRLLDSKRAELADHRVQVAEATSRYITLQDEYDRLFHARSQQAEPLRHHPVVVTTLNEHRCVICGTTDDRRIKSIEKLVVDRQCPLCQSQLPAAAKRDPKALEALQRVDRELATTRSRATNEALAVRRLEDEVGDVEAKHASISDQLALFERENELVARVTASNTESLRLMYINGSSPLQVGGLTG